MYVIFYNLTQQKEDNYFENHIYSNKHKSFHKYDTSIKFKALFIKLHLSDTICNTHIDQYHVWRSISEIVDMRPFCMHAKHVVFAK